MEFGRSIGDFSEAELRAYACEHVLYEITHFIRAAQAVEAARAGLFPMNFAIEVFALHVRNLLDFFAPRNARKTDACARHFYKDWEEPKLDLNLREARWMADKHIAHLTPDPPLTSISKNGRSTRSFARSWSSSGVSRLALISSAGASVNGWATALRSCRFPGIRLSYPPDPILRRMGSRFYASGLPLRAIRSSRSSREAGGSDPSGSQSDRLLGTQGKRITVPVRLVAVPTARSPARIFLGPLP
jgi:hypothetical protein